MNKVHNFLPTFLILCVLLRSSNLVNSTKSSTTQSPNTQVNEKKTTTSPVSTTVAPTTCKANSSCFTNSTQTSSVTVAPTKQTIFNQTTSPPAFYPFFETNLSKRTTKNLCICDLTVSIL